MTTSCSFSIELLPEFGWSIKDTPVYGPGSVFQGFVKLNIESLDLVVERIRLAFYAVETIPPFELSPGVLRTTKRTLFSVQQVLWHSQQQTLKLDTDADYSFPFTIQMPMVQFPPSMDHSFYRCAFQLIAFVDTPSSIARLTEPIRTDIPIICMPYVETSVLKSPLFMVSSKAHLTAKVKMSAHDFVPNESIPVRLDITSNKPAPSGGSLQYITAHLKLVQTLHIVAFDDLNDQVTTVAKASHKLLMIEYLGGKGTCCQADLELKLPADLTPSYNYGNLVQVSYKLQISIEQKGPMGGIWSYNVSMDDVPVTIGTLGYGIKSSSELKMYSLFEPSSSSGSKSMPLPKFMKAIEYEDALPLYDATRLPDYELQRSQHPIC
ncbi:general transcription repressor [Mucor velutinosus]|uniref:General transcription repressor n=1 Tax=Mucor velutinosus TaxID=708070 RepID=A0AAN7I0S2_9FUNG|nr:general transcription repressor [Mucor velutinosus]